MKNTITEGEWLKELARLSRKNAEGQTSREMAENFGVPLKKMLGYLAEAMRLGWLHRGERTAERIDGKQTTVTVYRVIPPRRSTTPSFVARRHGSAKRKGAR